MAETAADGLLRLDQQRRQADRTIGERRTQIASARALASNMGSRQIGSLNREFRRGVPNFQADWANRGLRNSGFYRQAAQRLMGDHARQVQDVNEGTSFTLNDLLQQSRGFQREYDDTLLSIREQRAALIAQGANEIRRLRG